MAWVSDYDFTCQAVHRRMKTTPQEVLLMIFNHLLRHEYRSIHIAGLTSADIDSFAAAVGGIWRYRFFREQIAKQSRFMLDVCPQTGITQSLGALENIQSTIRHIAVNITPTDDCGFIKRLRSCIDVAHLFPNLRTVVFKVSWSHDMARKYTNHIWCLRQYLKDKSGGVTFAIDLKYGRGGYILTSTQSEDEVAAMLWNLSETAPINLDAESCVWDRHRQDVCSLIKHLNSDHDCGLVL